MEPSRPHLRTVAFSIFIAIAVASDSARAGEGKDWKEAQRKDTIPTYEKFLESYPSGKYVVEAEKRLWSLIERRPSIEVYRRFLDNHGSSRFASEADRRLEALIEAGFTSSSEDIRLAAGKARLERSGLEALPGIVLAMMPLEKSYPLNSPAGRLGYRGPLEELLQEQGEEATPFLIEALRKRGGEDRGHIARALGMMGEKAKQAVPVLIDLFPMFPRWTAVVDGEGNGRESELRRQYGSGSGTTSTWTADGVVRRHWVWVVEAPVAVGALSRITGAFPGRRHGEWVSWWNADPSRAERLPDHLDVTSFPYPVHVAAFNGLIEDARRLLEGGADVRAVDDQGKQPLHIAAQLGDLEMARLLVDRGADVNANASGDVAAPPLFWASEEGRTEMIRLLLERGADPNWSSPAGVAVLHLAARADYEDIVSLLLAHGARHDAKTNKGQTALDLARANKADLAAARLREATDAHLARGGVPLSALADDDRRSFEVGKAAYEKREFETAMRHLRPLAEKGVAEAQYYVGYSLHNGEGGPRNYEEARRWYTVSAAQGYAPAQTMLGLMFAKGRGVSPDVREAIRLYELAAEQAELQALFNLGDLYAEGMLVERDLQRARRWFEAAVKQCAGDTKRWVCQLSRQHLRTVEEAEREGARDPRFIDPTWEEGSPPGGCWWECVREAGCEQLFNKPARFSPELQGSSLPGQMISHIRNPAAPAFTVGRGTPEPPGGSYSRGTAITFSVTIPTIGQGWVRKCSDTAPDDVSD